MGMRTDCKKSYGNFLGDRNVQNLDGGDGCTAHTFPQIRGTIHLKWVHLIVCNSISIRLIFKTVRGLDHSGHELRHRSQASLVNCEMDTGQLLILTEYHFLP